VRVDPGKDWGEIRLFGIHHDWTKETIRINQCRGLLEALGGKSSPVVLAGDFNAGRSTDSVDLLLNAGFRILAHSKTNTFPSKDPNVEIDFIMSKNLNFTRFKHQVIEEKLASDHRPVLVELFK